MSAAEQLRTMLRERVAPALRTDGFTGSGQIYRLRDAGGHHALLGFQKDRLNTAYRCRFTVNVTVYRRDAWDAARQQAPWLPTRPTASAIFPGTDGWQERIGFLGPAPHDHWWTVSSPTDVPAVAADVIRAVREDALPRMRARLAGRDQPPVRAAATTASACPWPGCHLVAVDVEEHLVAYGPPLAGPRHARPGPRAQLQSVEVCADLACRILKISQRSLRQASRYAGIPDEHQYTFNELVALGVLQRAHSRNSGEHLPQDVYRRAFTAVREACAQGLPEPDSKLVIHGEQATVTTDTDTLAEAEPIYPAGEWRPTFVIFLDGFAHSIAEHFA